MRTWNRRACEREDSRFDIRKSKALPILLLAAAMVFDCRMDRVQCQTPSRVAPNEARPTLFIIGDSTVNNHGNGLLGWGDPLSAYFDKTRINVENRARGGRSSRTYQAEGLWDQVLAAMKKNDFVLIQFGHNDGGPVTEGRARASLKGVGPETQEVVDSKTGKKEVVHTYGWYMQKYVADCKAKGATPIVLSQIPRNIWTDGRTVVRASADYGKWAAEAAKAESARFIDLNEIVAKQYEMAGPEKVKSLYFGEDHTHTTVAGAELNAASVIAGLRGLDDCRLCEYLLVRDAAASRQAQLPQPGFAESVLGRWDLTVQGPDGPYPSWLEVMLRKETELMGRFVGRFGSMRHLAQIEFRNGDLLFRVPVQYEQNSSDLVFKGRLTGDRIEGTTSDVDGKTLNWSGTRAPDLRRAVPPKWGRPIQLFDGKDLTGWKLRADNRGNCWSVAGGALTNNVPCVDIITVREFTDFKLHVEFNIVEKSNSGVYLRGRYEVQIQDDVGKTSDSLRMGGLYGFLRPTVNASGRPGEWQTYDITLIGRRLTVVLNGKTIINNEEIPGITGGALNSEEGSPGPIMLQGDHGKIAFRNITITPAQ